MKRIVNILLIIIVLLFFTGCEKKKEEIELTKDNYSLYLDYFVTGYGGESMGSDYKYYVSEATDDNGEYYSYGYVYNSVDLPFMVKSLTDNYTCQNCIIKIKVTGTVNNIYEAAGLNSSNRLSKNINDIVTINIKSDLSMNAVAGETTHSIECFGSPLNDVNGLSGWDLDWDIYSVSGTLIEKDD